MDHGRIEKPPPGLTLIEVVVVFVIIAALLVVLLPSISRAPDCSKRLVCASNVKGIGTSMKIYANENKEMWAVAPFDATAERFDYRVAVGAGEGTPQSPSRSQQSMSGPDGAKRLSVSRSYWLLVRSGDITVKQFICPTRRDDIEDPTTDLDTYYDFSNYRNLSYGFQLPFTSPDRQVREGADNRMVFAADKGPYHDAMVPLPPPGLQSDASPKDWRPYNSLNHQGEGQNALYADGHSSFARTPLAGVDEDNIYTIALDNWNLSSRIVGESPWLRASPPYSSTDSVIFP
jgi:type II secretory pathway pseudopilin PulG